MAQVVSIRLPVVIQGKVNVKAKTHRGTGPGRNEVNARSVSLKFILILILFQPQGAWCVNVWMPELRLSFILRPMQH